MGSPLPVAVITAKKDSQRLPGKNMLPLGGDPLTVWSIKAAKEAGLDTVVSSDIPEIKQIAGDTGCRVVHQVRDEYTTHLDVIRAAVSQSGWAGRPIILLQPTSPFRHGHIIQRCWRHFLYLGCNTPVVTTSDAHYAELTDAGVVNHARSLTLWDGCVAVYPDDSLQLTGAVGVRNLAINSIQIDTADDYISACIAHETYKPIAAVLTDQTLAMLAALFAQAGIGGEVNVIGRGVPPIPQDKPAIYLNHCVGYDGGRCDALFVIANRSIQQNGINDELRECARKAKIVVVRNNGPLPWLLQALPQIQGKFVPLQNLSNRQDDHLSTGCIAVDTLYRLGMIVKLIGARTPSELRDTYIPFHTPGFSREMALLRNAHVY